MKETTQAMHHPANRIPDDKCANRFRGWGASPETFANRTLAEELTGTYSQRVSGEAPRPRNLTSKATELSSSVFDMNLTFGAAPQAALKSSRKSEYIQTRINHD
jgi:hypothetical protein